MKFCLLLLDRLLLFLLLRRTASKYVQLPKLGHFGILAKLADKGPVKSISKMMQVAAFFEVKCDMSTIRTLKYHYN